MKLINSAGRQVNLMSFYGHVRPRSNSKDKRNTRRRERAMLKAATAKEFLLSKADMSERTYLRLVPSPAPAKLPQTQRSKQRDTAHLRLVDQPSDDRCGRLEFRIAGITYASCDRDLLLAFG